jgi:hypothetical protein
MRQDTPGETTEVSGLAGESDRVFATSSSASRKSGSASVCSRRRSARGSEAGKGRKVSFETGSGLEVSMRLLSARRDNGGSGRPGDGDRVPCRSAGRNALGVGWGTVGWPGMSVEFSGGSAILKCGCRLPGGRFLPFRRVGQESHSFARVDSMKDLPRRTVRFPVPLPTRCDADGPDTTAPLRPGWSKLLAWLPIRRSPAFGSERVIVNRRSQWGTWCRTEASRSALPYDQVGSW